LGGASRWWLDKSLAALAASLEGAGSRLILRRGPAAEAVSALARETGAQAVMWNRLYDPGGVERDKTLKTALKDQGLVAESCNAALLVEPWEVKTQAGQPFRVYTPFWKAARARADDRAPTKAPRTLPAPAHWPKSEALASFGLHPRHPDWSKGFNDWEPGEAGAQDRLDRFLEEALRDYPHARDRPAIDGTSRLSPHLHWGEIGPRQVWAAVQAATARCHGLDGAADKFLAELGWRTRLKDPDAMSKITSEQVIATFDRLCADRHLPD
jgi:deoxyribodipyrimidine photo-lyase